MSLEDIKERIVKKAQLDAQKTLERAEREAAGMLKKAEEEAATARKMRLDAIKREMEHLKARGRAAAELDASKMLLHARKELMQEVFAAVEEKIAALDSKTRAAHLSKLLAAAEKQLSVARVLCSERDRKLVAGKAEAAEILGGIIAEDKSGRVRLDLSYDAALESVREESMKEVAGVLFEK